jgi:CRP/FNR family transcriptional regulator, cyclic AMP receptor protein
VSDTAVIAADSLNAVDLFRGLPADDRQAIAERLRAHRYPAGKHIVAQADDCEEVYFILSGSVRVTYSVRSGKAVQFRDQHAGEMFGEMSAIDNLPRSAEVTALSDVFLATAEAGSFLDIASGYPAVARRLLGQLTARIRGLSDRVVEFSTLGVNNRIHAELLRLAREHALSGNCASINPSPTHADIAARVSTHREAVTRELAVLEKGGILTRGRGSLEITDVARLEDMVSNVFGD